jgi:putative inorganic carbon (HCO3(-)) transporter
MVLMVLVSEWATFDLIYSLPKISGMVLGLGIFFALAREGERARGWWWSLVAFLGIGLGVAALGFLGTDWTTTKIVFLTPIVNRLPKIIAGLQGAESGFHPNEVAGVLLWVLPMLVSISAGFLFVSQGARSLQKGIKTEKANRAGKQKGLSGWRLVGVIVLCLLALLFVGAVFVLTQSRGGYIGLALALPLLFLLALPPKRRWICVGVFVVLAILLGFVAASHWATIRDWVIGSDMASDPALSLNTLASRVEIWSRAIYGIQDFPFTGMGMNGFRKVMPVLYPVFALPQDLDIGHAHNEFLQAALDLGIPGLIAFIALYINAFWMLFDTWRKGQLQGMVLPYKAILLGLGGGLLAHLLYGLTDAVALGAKPGMLFWMLLGLIAGVYEQARTDKGVTA